MIVKPCCAHKELPPLLTEYEDQIIVFNTNGDVHFEKLYSSIARLLDNKCMLTVVTPKVTRVMMRYVRHCFNRGWVSEFQLRTHDDQSLLVRQELGEELFREHCICLYSTLVTDASCFFMLEQMHEPTASISITGYFPPEPLTDITKRPQSVTHSALYTQNEVMEELDAISHASLAPFHIERVKRSKQPKASDVIDFNV